MNYNESKNLRNGGIYMASSIDFVEYVCEQMSASGIITYKKMFGEFGVYCNTKFIGLICDNQLFIKKTESGEKLLPNCPEASPYPNAKSHFLIEFIEDSELLVTLLEHMWDELPFPKPKKVKVKEMIAD